MRFAQALSRKSTQWQLLLAVLLFFAALVGSSVYYERQRIVLEQNQRLAAEARVIDENMVRQIEGVSNVLSSVLEDLAYFKSLEDSASALGLRLKALTAAMPGVRTMNVLDAGGRVIASNRDELLGLDLAKREYFLRVAEDPDGGVLYLSRPFETLLGVYSMNLLRVQTDARGAMNWVVSATLDIEFFKVLLSSVRYAEDVWVAIAHIDGLLAIHVPEREGTVGANLKAPGSFFSRHLESGQPETSLTGMVKTTGEQAWMAQRTITAPELNMRGALVVAVARNPDMALRQWRFVALMAAALVLLVCAISSFALWQVQSSRDRLKRVMAEDERVRREAEERIRHMAFYDELTQLPNRRLLFDRLSQLLSAGVRHGRLSALFFLDLDRFKQLNDRHGHDKGDLLLKEVARRLQSELRQEDTAARLAGDEFVVMLSELSGDPEEAKRRAQVVADKILDAVGRDYELGGLSYRCTVSLGMTLFGDREEPMGDILKRADEDMYRAKAAGRNRAGSRNSA